MGRYMILVNGNNPPPSSGVCVCVCVCDGVEGRELDKVKNECHNRKQGGGGGKWRSQGWLVGSLDNK